MALWMTKPAWFTGTADSPIFVALEIDL